MRAVAKGPEKRNVRRAQRKRMNQRKNPKNTYARTCKAERNEALEALQKVVIKNAGLYKYEQW